MDHGKRRLQITLAVLTAVTLLNLLLTASLVGLLCCIVILVMVWGIRRGDYPLAKALSVFLFLYAAVNFAVFAITILFGSPNISALIWLGLYSAALMLLASVLQSTPVREYLKTAQPPEEKKKKIHFFHGGWRDL